MSGNRRRCGNSNLIFLIRVIKTLENSHKYCFYLNSIHNKTLRRKLKTKFEILVLKRTNVSIQEQKNVEDTNKIAKIHKTHDSSDS